MLSNLQETQLYERKVTTMSKTKTQKVAEERAAKKTTLAGC